MNKPAKLAFSDEATFTLTRGIVLIPFVITTFVFVLVLVTTDATLTELALPCAGTSALGFIGGGILGIVALGHRIAEISATVEHAANRLANLLGAFLLHHVTLGAGLQGAQRIGLFLVHRDGEGLQVGELLADALE